MVYWTFVSILYTNKNMNSHNSLDFFYGQDNIRYIIFIELKYSFFIILSCKQLCCIIQLLIKICHWELKWYIVELQQCKYSLLVWYVFFSYLASNAIIVCCRNNQTIKDMKPIIHLLNHNNVLLYHNRLESFNTL